MTDWTGDFVDQNAQELFPRTLGEALAKLCRARWPNNTAKNIEKAWDIDPTTARNVARGHASERTLTTAIRAEGWALLLALGEELTGQTHHEWEEARLSRIIEGASIERDKIRRLREKAALVRERADRVAATDHRQVAVRGQRLAP